MKTSEAIQITHTLSNPSKMPGWSYGLPAKECKTGSKLRLVPGSTCYNCYALKGCYVFPDVKKAQYKRLASIKHPLWAGAMSVLINSKKSKWFRWHDSGDVQDEDHLMKIFAVCKLTPATRHWLPTREAWVKHFLPICPKNLTIRFSAPMVDQAAPASWPNVSTVITEDKPWFGATSKACPAPLQDGKCNDCRNCWNKKISNVSYGKH